MPSSTNNAFHKFFWETCIFKTLKSLNKILRLGSSKEGVELNKVWHRLGYMWINRRHLENGTSKNVNWALCPLIWIHNVLARFFTITAILNANHNYWIINKRKGFSILWLLARRTCEIAVFWRPFFFTPCGWLRYTSMQNFGHLIWKFSQLFSILIFMDHFWKEYRVQGVVNKVGCNINL